MAERIKMIITLAKADFKKRFAGSFFGIAWMFVQPLATVLIYTLVFQVGFRATPSIPGVPYVIFIITGLVPWFYFSESLIGITNSLIEYNYLVKKVVFDVRLLPIIKLVSSTFAHLFFIAIMIVALIIAKIPIDYKIIEITYFSYCTAVLALGIGYFASSVNVFFRDMQQIIGIALQFGVWLAPIMYDENLFSARAEIVITILKFNPFYYIVKGYRMCLLNDNFDGFLYNTIYFWIVTIIIYTIGYAIFSRLKNHFSDVL